jgi:import receptor subunit TOM20
MLFLDLEQFLIDERHKTLHGKVAYNAYGVTYGEGDSKVSSLISCCTLCLPDHSRKQPESSARPENVEITRTSHSSGRQIGSALYNLSSYLSHSCVPSTRPSFSNGTAELHLVAMRDVKKGEVLTVAYVDVTQHPDESVLQSRRRRRFALARGWRFGCTCERCDEEGKEMSEENRTAEAQTEVKDGSKVEGSLRGPGEVRESEVE